MSNFIKDKSPRILACCGHMVIVAGLERMTFEVLRVLRERGFEVHCIVNSWENHRITALAEQVGAKWSSGHYYHQLDRHTLNPIKLFLMMWDILLTSGGLLRDALKFRPTHIFLPEFMSVLRNGPALAILRLFGIIIVLRLGNAPDQGSFYRFIWRWCVDPLVDSYVCNSNFTRNELLSHNILAHKTQTIYNAIPRREVMVSDSNTKDKGKVIYVGQIIPDKGLDYLLEAIGLLVKKGYDIRLDVVGQMDGWVAPAYAGYRERLRDRSMMPDLAGRVNFLGWREDVPYLMAGAAIHCCPSIPKIREGFGIVNIEAKQAGIPSVVFATGALPELITHAKDGWVCDQVTPEALAEGIEYYLSDVERLVLAGHAAKLSLERFNWEQFAEKWNSEFNKLHTTHNLKEIGGRDESFR